MVGCRSCVRLQCFLFGNKVIVVEVALVDGEHVGEDECPKDGEGRSGFQLAFAVEENRNGGKEDKSQTAESVLAEDGHAHLFEFAGEGRIDGPVFAFAHFGKLLSLTLAEETEECLWRNVEQEADACRDAQCDIEFLEVLLEALWVFGDFGQTEEA